MNPLFISNLTTLKQQLRLSGATGDDVEEIINTAIREARVGLYDNLGSSRVTTILGYNDNAAPTTDNEIMRARAQVTELKWIKMLLLRSLPSQFQDASGNDQSIWNEEGLARNASQSDLSREIKRLSDEVTDLLNDLRENTADPGIVSATVIEPTTTPPRPFSSIAGW